MNDEQFGALVGEKMREAVLNQLKSGDPPITTATYLRLKSEGIDDEETIRMIAHCMVIITYDILKGDKEWDLARYTEMLEALPD